MGSSRQLIYNQPGKIFFILLRDCIIISLFHYLSRFK